MHLCNRIRPRYSHFYTGLCAYAWVNFESGKTTVLSTRATRHIIPDSLYVVSPFVPPSGSSDVPGMAKIVRTERHSYALESSGCSLSIDGAIAFVSHLWQLSFPRLPGFGPFWIEGASSHPCFQSCLPLLCRHKGDLNLSHNASTHDLLGHSRPFAHKPVATEGF